MDNNKQNKIQSLSNLFCSEPRFKNDWKSILGYILGGIIGFFFFGYVFMPDIFNHEGDPFYYFIFFLIFVPIATFVGVYLLKYRDKKKSREFMDEQKIYKNMKNEIILLSEEKLGRKLSSQELQHVNKDRSLVGLESVIDMIKFENFSNKKLEKFLLEL